MARPTKRRTKHRGNAAGMIESRGATHSSARKNGKAGSNGRVDPRTREPTWRSAFTRALIAALIFAVVMMVMLKAKPAGVLLTTVMLVGVYTPFGYYFDGFLYRRRMAKLGIPVPGAKTGRKPSGSADTKAAPGKDKRRNSGR